MKKPIKTTLPAFYILPNMLCASMKGKLTVNYAEPTSHPHIRTISYQTSRHNVALSPFLPSASNSNRTINGKYFESFFSKQHIRLSPHEMGSRKSKGALWKIRFVRYEFILTWVWCGGRHWTISKSNLIFLFSLCNRKFKCEANAVDDTNLP